MENFNYNTITFPFKDLVEQTLNVNRLELLHLNSEYDYSTKFERKNDQSTHYHRVFYELARGKEFTELYLKFIEQIIKPTFNSSKIVFQKIPTFRIHFPGNIAVGEFHRDRDYRDQIWAKEVKEMNFFLPLTSAFGTNSIWVESLEGKEDFKPIIANYGEVVKWDGSNLLHGNKTNREKTTRVSFDFRVMKMEDYKPSSKGSINTKTIFALGGYYESL